MNFSAYQDIFLESIALLILLGLAIWPLSRHIHSVFSGKTNFVISLLYPIEKFFLRLLPQKIKDEMNWKYYTANLLISCFVVTLFLFGVMIAQGLTPLLALNIAISFVTTTNWQAFAPETSLHVLAQILGISVVQFFAPASGFAVLFAFTRSLVRKENPLLGNYWVDVMRIILYILLPLAFVSALVLGFGGVMQTFQDHLNFVGLAGEATQLQTGPIASQSAIALLGNNGGGFYGAGWSHPFANPTHFTNLISIFLMLLLPTSLCFFFGRAVGDPRQGVAIFLTMLILYTSACFVMITTQVKSGSAGGTETRLSIGSSALWAATTTSTSTGATSSDMSQLKPKSLATAIFMMVIGEVAFGGAGTGLLGMLVYVLLSVFITGLMVGRTPEYLGNKIGPYDMKILSLILLTPIVLVLGGTWIMLRLVPDPGQATTLIYGLASLAQNNGSSLSVAPFTSDPGLILGSCVMFLGRYFFLVPLLALAGALAAKKITPVTSGTVPTHTPLFVGVILGVILLIGALSFLPTLTLGPLLKSFAGAV